MKKIAMFCIAVIAVLVVLGEGPTFSPAETNRLARRLIYRAMRLSGCHTIPDAGELYNPDEDLGTWHGFLGVDETNGWTVIAKKAAFDWYLSTLGTCDCQSLSRSDKLLVLNAVEMCGMLAYTNAVPSLKALALNPRGIHREVALATALKFSAIEDQTTQFVESILTNITQYTAGERLGCYWGYARRLRSDTAAGDAYDCAVGMFYRNRKVDWIGGMTVDRLLSERIEGYANSSNRLDTALFMLAPTNTRPQFVEYFTSVTNQLLSSGRPLVQLDIGEGGD
jgi:hypothetical protein